MVVLRTGVDILEIKRLEQSIKKYGARFIHRIFTEREIHDAKNRIESLAVRFAAKEAVSKALGTGIGPISWKEIEVVHGVAHEPNLELSGNAKKIALDLGIDQWSVSLSHTRNLAIAFVTAIGFDNSK